MYDHVCINFVPMWPRTAPHFSESALLSLLLVPRVIFAVRRLYGGQADGYCREFCSKKTWWLRLRAASVVTTVLSPSPKVFVILEFLALLPQIFNIPKVEHDQLCSRFVVVVFGSHQ